MRHGVAAQTQPKSPRETRSHGACGASAGRAWKVCERLLLVVKEMACQQGWGMWDPLECAIQLVEHRLPAVFESGALHCRDVAEAVPGPCQAFGE